MLADGVTPSNEGRGYVLRRLLRRAARHGRLLGIRRPFLYEVVSTVVKENETAYPELKEKQAYIEKTIQFEEENFNRTIDKGFEILQQMIEQMEGTSEKVLSGEDAFRLYDTYGFPIDLTKEIIEERNLDIDEDAFSKLMEQQKERARKARMSEDAVAWADEILNLGVTTPFVGYDTYDTDAKVLAILVDN